MTYATGDVYDGNYRMGIRHGRGSYIYADSGAVYKGEWRDDQMNGKGVLMYADGRVDVGEFLDGALLRGDVEMKEK